MKKVPSKPLTRAQLAELKALAGELGIPFECYDHRTPDEIKRGVKL